MNDKGRKVDYIVHGVRWFDKYNGTTYNSVCIVRASDGARLFCPMNYGYGDHYRQRALEAMHAAGWMPREINERDLFAFERLHDYPILWYVVDGLKRECVANGGE